MATDLALVRSQLAEIEAAIQDYHMGRMAVSSRDANGQQVEVNRVSIANLYRRRDELLALLNGRPILPRVNFYLHR